MLCFAGESVRSAKYQLFLAAVQRIEQIHRSVPLSVCLSLTLSHSAALLTVFAES